MEQEVPALPDALRGDVSLPHLLLGMLAEPASGYDLKKSFESSIRNFWSAELSQVYPALKKLEREGLLTSTMQESSEGPAKRVYERTDAGRARLIEWLSDGPLVRHERLAYLVQVFFLAEVDDEVRLRFFEALSADFVARRAELVEIEAGWSADDPRYPDDLPDEDFYPQLTLRLGLMKYQTIIDWSEECLTRIRARRTRSSAPMGDASPR